MALAEAFATPIGVRLRWNPALTPLRVLSSLSRTRIAPPSCSQTSGRNLAGLASARASTRSTCPVVLGLKPKPLRHTPLSVIGQPHEVICLPLGGLACRSLSILHRTRTEVRPQVSEPELALGASKRAAGVRLLPSRSCDYRSFELFGGRLLAISVRGGGRSA